MRSLRSKLALIGATTMLLGALSSDEASAGALLTIDVPSRHVDAAQVKLSQFPEGVDPGVLHANVLLPDGYDPQLAYPVLYLLHGHGSGFASWARSDLGDIANTAAGLNAIVVMPEGGNGWYTDWWNSGARGAPAWERYMLRDVIPQVESRFPIREARRWHAIAGISMGGEGAMYLASQRPGYFGSAASFSGILSTQRPEWPTLFDTQGERHQDVFGDPVSQGFYWAGHNPTELVSNLQRTRLFVAVGDGVPNGLGEIGSGAVSELLLRPQSQDFVAAAQGVGANVTYLPQNGIHNWPYWRRDLTQAIGWGLFGRVTRPDRSWSLRTVARTGWAWGVRFTLAKAPERVTTFSQEGQVLRGDGDGAVRVRIGRGCGFETVMPFEQQLSAACSLRASSSSKIGAR